MQEELKKYIREVPDFPKPGILFYDISTLLKDPKALRMTVDSFVWFFSDQKVDKVVGIESRGFMFAPIVAYNLNAGFVPVRKPGKLPGKTVGKSYDLEYGSDRVEMHEDGVEAGERVLIVDDLLATGGTAAATAELVTSRGANVIGLGFIVELLFLKGRDRLGEYQLDTLISYEK